MEIGDEFGNFVVRVDFYWFENNQYSDDVVGYGDVVLFEVVLGDVL